MSSKIIWFYEEQGLIGPKGVACFFSCQKIVSSLALCLFFARNHRAILFLHKYRINKCHDAIFRQNSDLEVCEQRPFDPESVDGPTECHIRHAVGDDQNVRSRDHRRKSERKNQSWRLFQHPFFLRCWR